MREGLARGLIRGCLALGIAYAAVWSYDAPDWLILAAWIYLPVTIALNVGLAHYAAKRAQR